MGDSEDDDRSHSRDKFRRERSDYGSSDKGRRDSRDSRDKRPSWRDDRRRSRDEYDDERRRYGYSRGGRDWSPPPAKRMRKDWDMREYPGPRMMAPYGIRPPWPMPPPGPHGPLSPMMPGLARDSPISTSQLPMRHKMLTFKQFLAEQDDSIDEEAAIVSYNEYKSEFKRKQMEEFFEKHKDEDWFMSLYHPTHLEKAKEVTSSHFKSRVEAFLFLLDSGRLDQVSLSSEHSRQVIKTMDAAVIKMEGGTENDLLSLDKSNDDEQAMDQADEDHIRLKKKAKKKKKKKKVVKEESSDEEEEEEEEEDSDSSSSLEDHKEAGGYDGDMEDVSQQVAGNNVHNSVSPDADAAATEEGTVQQNSKDANGAPRALHLTRSVYIRHISPKVSTEDIVKACKTLPGFLRIALAEADPDKNYERRGWVTFTHETDIKSILAQLSLVKVKDSLLASCSINRDLTRRVKHAPPAAWTKKAVHSDIQLALKLIKYLDEKNQLWEHAVGEEEHMSNPILTINEVLLLEGEEESVAMAAGGEEEEGAITDPSADVTEETDEKLKLLEKLLWYLRLVHSLDFYNAVTFPSEDTMPHRCGIFTVRSKVPLVITQEDLTKYIEEMEEKIKPLLTKKKELSSTEIEKFGKKDPEMYTEVERFVELNTQKLSESKYLCPLSGKKFKGPEFVKKHIFNKHMDKVEAVRKEAEFFNNYLCDPERPMPLEGSIKSVLPPNPKTPSSEDSPSLGTMISPMGGVPTPGGGGGWRQDPQMMHDLFNRGGGGYGYPMMGEREPRHRGGGRRGRRRYVDYKDLDAPDEIY